MTLSRKVILRNAALVLGLVVLATMSLIGLNSLRDDVVVALEEYNDLGRIGKVDRNVTIAAGQIPEQPEAAKTSLEAAKVDLQQFIDFQKIPKNGEVERVDEREAQQGEAIMVTLERALDHLNSNSNYAEAKGDLDQALLNLGQMQHSMDETIHRTQKSANESLTNSILTIGILSGVIAAAAITLSILQYLSVITPLRRLRRAVGAVAAGNFNNRIAPTGDTEYRALANDFNLMASELSSYYHTLQEKVAVKSRQLALSERLASVGFLAAGVAHEINNPLSIISGYAELVVKRQGRELDPEIARTLSIIRDEAFRCKKITSKLLALSRGSPDQREVISVADVAHDVADLIGGLKKFDDRQLKLVFDDREQYRVEGNPAELRQVLLNLTINGMEAAPEQGEITIEGHRNNGNVQLLVKDNGRGMTTEVLNRVFEPFFTEKRGSSEPGTGLGLSITHAIVEAHGGTIRAESEGPGKGSCFTITLPAATEKEML